MPVPTSLPRLLLFLHLLSSLIPHRALSTSTTPKLRSTLRSKFCPQILPPPPDDPRIINGDPSPPSLTALTLLLRSPLSPTTLSYNICTAVRLSPSWAVTAAHCYVNTSWTAHTTLHPNPITLAQVFPHPNYTLPTQRRFDISLLLLYSPPPHPYPHLHLNNNPSLPHDAAFLRVLGYGKTSLKSSSPTPLLHIVDIPVVPFPVCKARYASISNAGFLDPARQLCAGYLFSGGCDSCVGDSGGPLLQYDALQNPVLVALVSAGNDCALPFFPGINLRIHPFITWMRQQGAQFSETSHSIQFTLPDGLAPNVPPPVSQSPSYTPSAPPPGSPLPIPVVVAPSPLTSHVPPTFIPALPSPWVTTPAPLLPSPSAAIVVASSDPNPAPSSPSGQGSSAVPYPSPSPSPRGLVGAGVGPTVTPKAPPENEEDAVVDDVAEEELAVPESSATPQANGQGGRGLQVTSVGEGSRTAAIVAGAVGGAVLIIGLLILLIKKKR